MKTIYTIITVLLLTGQAMGAAFASQRTGDWSVTSDVEASPWYDDGAQTALAASPIGSDSVEIAATHVVDYDGDLTHTASITIKSGGTLRGDGARVLTLSNAVLTVEAGGAITNTGGVFEIRGGGGHNQAATNVLLSGTGGSHVTITGESTSNYIFFSDGGYLRGGKVTATYTDFSKVGTSTVPAFDGYPSAADTYSWTHCTFDADCGRIDVSSGLVNTAVFVIEDCQHNSTSQNLDTALASAAISTGTRSIQRNYFAGSLGSGAGSWLDVTFKHNIMWGGIVVTDNATSPWGSASEENFIVRPDDAMYTPFPTATEPGANYWLQHPTNGSTAETNVRWMAFRTAGNFTVANQIYEPGLTDAVGDLLNGGAPSGAFTYTVQNNLVLPIGDGTDAGKSAGQFISCLGNANTTFIVSHNTWPATQASAESGACSYGETYNGHENIFSYVKSNLIFNPAGSSGGYVFQRRVSDSVADGCASSNITNNGKWGLSTGDYGVGYDDTAGTGMFSSGSPGTNDVVVTSDPFFDSTRRVSTWAVEVGAATAGQTYHQKVTAAVGYMKTDPSTRIPALIAWVRDGYRPTNASLRNAGHDSVTIGAVEGIFSNTLQAHHGMMTAASGGETSHVWVR